MSVDLTFGFFKVNKDRKVPRYSLDYPDDIDFDHKEGEFWLGYYRHYPFLMGFFEKTYFCGKGVSGHFGINISDLEKHLNECVKILNLIKNNDIKAAQELLYYPIGYGTDTYYGYKKNNYYEVKWFLEVEIKTLKPLIKKLRIKEDEGYTVYIVKE